MYKLNKKKTGEQETEYEKDRVTKGKKIGYKKDRVRERQSDKRHRNRVTFSYLLLP